MDSLPDRPAGMMTADSSVCGCRETGFCLCLLYEGGRIRLAFLPLCAMGLRQTRCSKGAAPLPERKPLMPPLALVRLRLVSFYEPLCLRETLSGDLAFIQLLHTLAFSCTNGHGHADVPCGKNMF